MSLRLEKPVVRAWAAVWEWVPVQLAEPAWEGRTKAKGEAEMAWEGRVRVKEEVEIAVGREVVIAAMASLTLAKNAMVQILAV